MLKLGIDISQAERAELEDLLNRQYVVRDLQGIVTCFDPADGETALSSIRKLATSLNASNRDASCGDDLVLWQGGRVRGVLRRGPNGEPLITVFRDDQN